MLLGWLVVGHFVATNPAHSMRGPKHVVKRGKTPVLTADQARELLDSIDVSTVVGLRDRALIALMAYSFARVSAVVAMRVEDYFATSQALVGAPPRKRAAIAAKCRRTTIWKPISTPICTRPGTPTQRRRPSSAPRTGTPAR
jgi:site-specific recombinase XerC